MIQSRAKSALVFPGQGAQHVGMASDIYAAFQVARDVVDECDSVLGGGLKQVMFTGPLETLSLTQNTQPAILCHSIALLRVLETHYGLQVSNSTYAIGHSLGEYSALVATGSLALKEAITLVRLRGQAMQSCVKTETSMRALMVRDDVGIERLLAEISSSVPPGEVAQVANINSREQIVLSGTKVGVEAVASALHSKGLTSRSLPLPVSAPFHCSLMDSAALIMKPALEAISFKKPTIDVISNVTGKPMRNPEEFGSQLVEQITKTVQWRDSVKYAKDQGVSEWIVIGPSKVLSNLLKKEVPLDAIMRMATADDLKQFPQS